MRAIGKSGNCEPNSPDWLLNRNRIAFLGAETGRVSIAPAMEVFAPCLGRINSIRPVEIATVYCCKTRDFSQVLTRRHEPTLNCQKNRKKWTPQVRWGMIPAPGVGETRAIR